MKNQKPAETTPPFRHAGSCHCGAVRYAVILEGLDRASKCNCSICVKLNSMCVITTPDAFTLLAGEGSLSEYAWGRKMETRYFCKHCGVYCFSRGHLAELDGDQVAVNVNTLDDVDPNLLTVEHWDGRHDNWQAGPRAAPWPVFAPAQPI